MKTSNTCPKCQCRLENTMERRIAEHRMPEKIRVLACGTAFIERSPTGIELVGECIEHGLQRVALFGPEEYVKI